MKLDTMNKEEPFKVRAYGYGELAMEYFHNSTKKSASTQLGRWIKQNNKLNRELISSGFKKGQKILTPMQVLIIINYLGYP